MRITLPLCLMCLAGLFGCQRSDEITRYTVAVSEGPGSMHSTSGNLGPHGALNPHNAGGAVADRMLAAIIPLGKQTWFFKLTGPNEIVGRQQSAFVTMVQSVRFDEETAQPAWDLPEGWRQRGPSGMRFATVEIPAEERTLELTVIPLDTRGDLDEYVLDNINRWRGQLGLEPVAALEAPEPVEAPVEAQGRDAEAEEHTDHVGPATVRRFPTRDLHPVTMVNLLGLGGAAEMPAGFDMANHPPIDGQQLPGLPAASGDGLRLTYETPDGWSEGKVGGMRRAAFEIADGERKAEVTVISLPQSGGERLANINRWRNQIELDDTTQQQLSGELRTIPAAGTTGDFIELMGPAGEERPEAILAVLADLDGSTWFFKLKGDAELARRERERFQAFVQSVRFTTAAEPEAGTEAGTQAEGNAEAEAKAKPEGEGIAETEGEVETVGEAKTESEAESQDD